MASCSSKARSYTASSGSTAYCETEHPIRWADIADLSEEEDATDSLPGDWEANTSTRAASVEELQGLPEVSNASQDSAASSWQPNIGAPEFIPTLSMACPVVGICCVLPPAGGGHSVGFVPAFVVDSLPGATPAVPGCEAPQPHVALSAGACEGEASGTPRRSRKPSSPRKPRPSALQISSCKPVAKERRQSVQLQGEMPEASEEEWQHRTQMRLKSISLSKETDVYRWFSNLKSREERDEHEPMTPDPTDRTVSKRHWKYLVQCWRTALHGRFAEDCNGSTQSHEDWQSTVTATTETGGATAVIDGDDAASS